LVIVKEQVRFADTDMLGIAHHANYLRWFETARVAFLRQAGVNLWDLMNEGYSFPVSEVRCVFKSPARYDDCLCVAVTMRELSRAKMVFAYQIWREADQKLLAEGYSCNVFTTAAGRVARLNNDFYQRLNSFYLAQQSAGADS
jgi:acyl-CoA thioester hydrolase